MIDLREGAAERREAFRLWTEAGAECNDAQRRHMAAAMKQAIAEDLTARQRRALLMYYVEGKGIPQIAAELDRNKSTVARHLKVARTKLNRQLRFAAVPLTV